MSQSGYPPGPPSQPGQRPGGSPPPQYAQSQPPPYGEQPPAPPQPWMPPNAGNTPNAERYLLEADALRRRQLRSALLHGSSRTWREHRRIWPGMVSGLIVVAVILASFMVVKAFRDTQAEQQKQEEELNQTPTSVTTAPTVE